MALALLTLVKAAWAACLRALMYLDVGALLGFLRDVVRTAVDAAGRIHKALSGRVYPANSAYPSRNTPSTKT